MLIAHGMVGGCEMKKILTLFVTLALLMSCATPLTWEQKRSMLSTAYPTWSDEEIRDILNRIIWTGMTKEQAVLSWGRPSSINSSGGIYGSYEQWVYKKYYGRMLGSTYKYLYFENGKLTSWQQ